MTEPQYIAMYALFGATGFVCGALLQQELSIKNLFDAVKRDPYVYLNRQKFYPVLSTFSTEHETRLWNRSVGLKDKICQFLVAPIFKYFVPKPLEEVEEPPMPNMMDLLKYGLPSAENLLVHKDYIMSRGIETNSATWICEHFRSGSMPDESSQYLRYDDVFLLSTAAADVGRVFTRPIWQKLEQYVKWKVQQCGSVYAYTGPIYAPKNNASNKCWLEYRQCADTTVPVPVPSHYFKVLIVEESQGPMAPEPPTVEPTLEAYIIRNGCTETFEKLCDYRVSIQDIVAQTGLRFSTDLQAPKVLSNNGKIEIDLSLASISAPMLID
ncbi:nuclease-like [Drosophila obscura]|uniref:nuclease-like n=1 Tax=Drosophila obscura TaxID=7282 RepID=UPI001BB2A88D|nr:nuclease-like [Drosophila obscura]